MFERQKQMGIFPADAELTPLNPYAEETSVDGKPWPRSTSSGRGTRCPTTRSGCSAGWPRCTPGFLSHTDHEIGRLLDFLEESGQLENTIVVLVSDNGASGEGGPNGSVNENKFFNGIPDDDRGEPAVPRRARLARHLQPLPGRLGVGVQHAVQDVEALQLRGRRGRPAGRLVAEGIKAKGELRHQFLHATDIVPTMYDCLGVELPEVVKGYPQIPLEGVSFRSTFESDDVPTPKETGFFSMLGSRAIWHKGWKAVSVHPTIAGWGHFDHDRWELYDTEDGPDRDATTSPPSSP